MLATSPLMGFNAPGTAHGISSQGSNERLESWKEIAAYLRKDVRTAQRYEKRHGLPIHRQDQTGAVYAFKSELDAWRNSEKSKEAEKSLPDATDENLNAQVWDTTQEQVYVSDTPVPTRWPIGKRRFMVSAIILAIVAAVGIVWRMLPGTTPPIPARLIVLPFDNLSDDPKQEYFARGISDDLTSEFGRLQAKSMTVVARATAERYKGKALDQIGRELNVQYVVEGSVRREANQVRMNVQLILVGDQSQLWAKSYDEQMSAALSVPGELARLIEAEVARQPNQRSHFSLFSTRAAVPPQKQVKIGTRDPKAYDDFLHGRYFWSKRGVDSMARAMGYFRAAIADDPNYASAYAGLADGLALLGSAQSGVMPPSEAFPKARQAAQKALSIDESLPEAHASMGYISLVYDHDRARAKSEFERAIELDPSYPTAHQWFGLYYDSIGDTEAAIASVKRAREQDSLSLAVNIALAESYYFARDYERAAVQAKAAIELDNSSALAHFNLGRVYVMQKRYSDAVGEFQLARNSSPNAATLVPLGYANALAGNAKEAGKYLKELDLLSKSQYVPAIYYAMLYTGLNDKEQAFHYLDKALGEHCDYLVFLQQDPMADPLRGDARFLQITSQIAGP